MLDLAFQERKKDGQWRKPKFNSIAHRQIEQIRTEPDASIVPLLFGASTSDMYGYSYGYYSSSGSRFMLSGARLRALLPLLGSTGRLFARFGHQRDEITPIAWDDGPPWQFRLQVAGEAKGKNYQISGWLYRGDERRSIAEPRALLTNVVLWNDDRAAFLDNSAGVRPWLNALRKEKAVQVGAKEREAFLSGLLLLPNRPPVDLPEELRVAEERVAPATQTRGSELAKSGSFVQHVFGGSLSFDYADRRIAFSSKERGIWTSAELHASVKLRDEAAEKAAVAQLEELGFREARYYRPVDFDSQIR